MTNNTNRINWLDISRGLAFLMVIYSHLEYVNNDIMRFFSPVFLTTFFFVSGYLHKSGYSFGKFFEQRTRTLLWPFLSLGSIMIVMQHVFTFKNSALSWTDGFKGLLLQNGENQILWFIAALYVYSIAFFWIEKISGKYLAVVCSLCFLLNWIYIYIYEGRGLPWHITSSGFACAYMGAGMVYKRNESIIDSKISKCILCIAAGLYVLVVMSGHSCSYYGSKYLIDSIALTTLGLALIVSVSKGISCLNNNRFVLYVGANTLFYFAFHGKIYAFLEAFINKAFSMNLLAHSEILDTCIGFVVVFLDALILIPFAWLVNKYMPWLLGKGFKLWNAK